jgi:transposase
MRGFDDHGEAAFAYVSCESRVPPDHPLRIIRAIVDEALKVLSPEFDALYAATGRSSVPPEKLLRALLLQAFYSVRSERQLMEQLDYNLLFRWFVGLAIDAPVWDVTVFTKNRERLLRGDIAVKFMNSVLNLPPVRTLLSRDHFTVDGTLVEAWASMKSFKRKPDEGKAGSGDDAPPPVADGGRNAEVDFHGETRSNATHASTTDPEARLYRKGKGKEAKLCFLGHALMENRHGLFIDTRLTLATGTAEREAAGDMIGALAGRHRITVGADKNYDTAAFVAELRGLNATPHVARNITRNRSSAIDGRVTHHPGYAISQVIRKRIEEGFGWVKAVGMMTKTKLHGTARVGWRFQLTAAAYDLIRLPKLLKPDAPQAPASQEPVSNISNTCGLNPRFSAAC